VAKPPWRAPASGSEPGCAAGEDDCPNAKVVERNSADVVEIRNDLFLGIDPHLE
jgi:hypothetical protein